MSEVIFWKAIIKEVANHGDRNSTVVFRIIEDNGMLTNNGNHEGVLVFDETEHFPYKEGDTIELVMRLVDG